MNFIKIPTNRVEPNEYYWIECTSEGQITVEYIFNEDINDNNIKLNLEN